jgi:hypothetical protein
MRTGNPAVGVNLARPSGWLFSSNKAASIVRGRRLALKCRERHGRECAKRFFACGVDAKEVHLRHRQRAAGAGDFANGLELGRFGRARKLIVYSAVSTYCRLSINVAAAQAPAASAMVPINPP